MNQHEITERRPLLDASGNLTEPGYAKSLLPLLFSCVYQMSTRETF